MTDDASIRQPGLPWKKILLIFFSVLLLVVIGLAAIGVMAWQAVSKQMNQTATALLGGPVPAARQLIIAWELTPVRMAVLADKPHQAVILIAQKPQKQAPKATTGLEKVKGALADFGKSEALKTVIDGYQGAQLTQLVLDGKPLPSATFENSQAQFSQAVVLSEANRLTLVVASSQNKTTLGQTLTDFLQQAPGLRAPAGKAITGEKGV